MEVNQGESATIARTTSAIRDKLVTRREKLETARAELPQSEQLARLLTEVDAALERIENGSYGLCEVCRGAIEADRLATDPLVRTCLDDLTKVERRALEQDLDLARRIQNGLLPTNQLTFAGWNTGYHYEPVGRASGDYCDLITSEDDELLFLLGDVAGKGVAASVLMAHLHAIFRSLISLRLPFQELMERANRIFCESTGGQHYATMVCGKAGRSGEVEICNAGHCPPLWIRHAEAIGLPATGLPVGLFCSTPYSATRVTLGPGQSVLLYTDGVTESRDPSGAEYGIERLARTITSRTHPSASALVAACLDDLRAFRNGAPIADDVTILAVRRTAPPGARCHGRTAAFRDAGPCDYRRHWVQVWLVDSRSYTLSLRLNVRCEIPNKSAARCW